MAKAFKERVLDLRRATDSKLVLAFDLGANPYKLKRPGERLRERLQVYIRAHEVLSELEGLIAGAKIGLPLILGAGPDLVEELIRSFRSGCFFICDSKMADIGYVNRLVAEQVFEMGFDGLIAHAAIGVGEGLDEVVRVASEMDRGVLALCAMSHRGAEDHLNRHFDALLDLAMRAGTDGLVLPASRPDCIARARRLQPEALIFSPGVGAQGAPFGSAISAGADFEIVGRALYGAPDPAARAREILRGMKG